MLGKCLTPLSGKTQKPSPLRITHSLQKQFNFSWGMADVFRRKFWMRTWFGKSLGSQNQSGLFMRPNSIASIARENFAHNVGRSS